MSLNFHEYELGDLCNISSSKRIFAREYVDEGIPFYRGKEIIELFNNRDVSNELFITRDKYESIKGKYGVPEEGDILLSSVGTLGVPYLVKNEKFYFKDGNLTWFKDFDSKLNNKFLYWWFQSIEAKYQINNKCIGSTQKALPIKTLEKFEISVPSIKTQIQIVDILESISNKIKTNISINKNLHQQRKLLFKHWFIDFDLFSSHEMKDTTFGLIPKSWEIYDFKEILTKRTEKSNDDSIPMFSVTNTGIHPREDKFNKKLAASTSKFKLIYKNDLVFGMSREILNWGLMEEQIGGVSSAYHIFKINEKKVNPFYVKSFIENYMPYFKDIIKPASREGQGIDQNILMIKQIYVPSENIFKEFYQIDMNYNNLININNTEIERLTQLRNLLLPKLMSGEIDVSKINCE